jgi:hypothetical protein
MTRLLLRACRAAVCAGSPVTAAFWAAGCAWQDEPERTRARPGVAYMPTSSIKDATAPMVTAKPKVAAGAKNTDTRMATAKPPPIPPSKPAPPAHETACVSVEQCASVLKAMIDDPNRAWMKRPASAATLANGVRLFAYRALRQRLSCSELTTALHETTIAAAAFSGPVSGLQHDQIDRVRTLSGDVEAELKTERAGRCGPVKENSTGQALEIRQGAAPPVDGETTATGRELLR